MPRPFLPSRHGAMRGPPQRGNDATDAVPFGHRILRGLGKSVIHDGLAKGFESMQPEKNRPRIKTVLRNAGNLPPSGKAVHLGSLPVITRQEGVPSIRR